MDIVTASLEDKKALNIQMLDLSKDLSIADYLVIASSESAPQTRAIQRAVEEDLLKAGYKTGGWQGKPESNWIILDLGSIIVHIMGLEERAKYSLEEIWSKSGITYHI